jgi:predicted ATPase
MAKLDSITIQGFKSIRSVEKLPLRDVNVVIGANGAGKSNFIGAFAMLRAMFDGKLVDYVARSGGADRIVHFGTKVTEHITLGFSMDAEKFSCAHTFYAGGGDILYPTLEVDWEEEHPLRLLLNSWRIYHLHDTSDTSPLKKTADLHDNRFLRADGANLPAFLYLLREKHAESYQLIRKTVQRVAPFFEDFQLEPQMLNPNKIQLEWRHKKSDAYFDVSSLSDGTLRFMALATLFLAPKELRPSILLIDEPELGLHPYAITLLASLIQQASRETQVIAATQSPQLLDHFTPEDVLVVDQVDGASKFTRLDSERLTAWLEVYSLGQLWEKNELGGRPQPA